MHVVIIIELMTIVLSIIVFEPKLVPMFFHMDSIREFKSFLLVLELHYHCCHHCWCKGRKR
jgi:hypothetical protein